MLFDKSFKKEMKLNVLFKIRPQVSIEVLCLIPVELTTSTKKQVPGHFGILLSFFATSGEFSSVKFM